MAKNDIRKNRIEAAIELAAQAHDGQFRKGTNTPYITHPYAVGLMLMNAGCAETVVIAGILHDTVEDTDLTLACIRKDFGESVADIVDECSENKSLRWRERKIERIEALKDASTEVCLVTCADKLHNLRTVISEYDNIGDVVWERFHGGLEAQAWYYQSILESMRTHIEHNKKVSYDGAAHEQFSVIFRQLQQAVMYLFEGEIE
ncbi:bifunctional (p)ppGpp synthetase/guanosine-3',5'-bis(diphosphate) 3'-pyrophosphohydrolase [Candidatus Poribacteria bacterium]|nr:bifunctional (p)ppGpp synthetase/guanosine-3',5'-bis(diphosphate) 3'-pyrophosphohydrolase [Candidatus Poribacteria bacterium]